MNILTLDNDKEGILRKESAPVTDFKKLPSILEKMHYLLRKKKGFGLSAVQVGILERFFIMHVRYLNYVNYPGAKDSEA